MSRDYLLRLHTATDWRTESAPEIAAYLHRWETAAIKAGEVLRETSERTRSLYFWATIAFIAGFSERRAKVLIDGALGGGGPDDDRPPPPPQPATPRDPELETRGI